MNRRGPSAFLGSMALALLHHSIARFAAAAPHRLLVLHGIFGQGRNWSTVANVLVQLRPDWEVALADLRMHGRSQEGFAPPHTLAACAEDVAALAASLGGITAILGHSFGAKVALSYLKRDAPPPAQAWIVDADPAARPPSGESWQMLALLRSLPREWETRERFVGALMETGLPPAAAGWMATNLVREGKSFRLAFDLDAIEALLRDYFANDLEASLRSPGCDVRVIHATGSPILDDVLPRLHTAGVRVHPIAGGHWLNADNPSSVAQLLAAELPK